MSGNTRKTTSVRTLRDPVEQIWLAGLGALAVTEEEGTRLFKSLVKKGEGFEKDTRERVEKVMEATKAAPANAMTRIEEGMSDTFTGVLHRLGVPSRREINNLTRRVEGLATSLERRTPKPRKVASRRPRATRRTKEHSTPTATA